MRLDLSVDALENTRFMNTYHHFVKPLTKQTEFTDNEIKCILFIYHKIVLSSNQERGKFMTNKAFCKIYLLLFKINDIRMIQNVTEALDPGRSHDVTPESWVKLFSIFMTKNVEEKLRFIFDVYDVKGTGLLDRDIIIQAVSMFFTGDDDDEVQDLRSDMVENIFTKFDIDRDGFVSFEDYRTVVQSEPDFVEFLGKCLPSTEGKTLMAYCANILSHLDNP